MTPGASRCHIRKAGAADREVVEAVLSACGLSSARVLDPGSTYWVAEQGGGEQPVGVVGAEWGVDAALLKSAAVLLPWRGRGYGKQLVERATGEARRRGMAVMYLFAPGAMTYWPRLGFVETAVESLASALPDVSQVIEYRVSGTLCCERAWKLELPR